MINTIKEINCLTALINYRSAWLPVVVTQLVFGSRSEMLQYKQPAESLLQMTLTVSSGVEIVYGHHLQYHLSIYLTSLTIAVVCGSFFNETILSITQEIVS